MTNRENAIESAKRIMSTEIATDMVDSIIAAAREPVEKPITERDCYFRAWKAVYDTLCEVADMNLSLGDCSQDKACRIIRECFAERDELMKTRKYETDVCCELRCERDTLRARVAELEKDLSGLLQPKMPAPKFPTNAELGLPDPDGWTPWDGNGECPPRSTRTGRLRSQRSKSTMETEYWKVVTDEKSGGLVVVGAGELLNHQRGFRKIVGLVYGDAKDAATKERATLMATAPEMKETLEDILEWMCTGAVDGVYFDDGIVSLRIREVLNKMRNHEPPTKPAKCPHCYGSGYEEIDHGHYPCPAGCKPPVEHPTRDEIIAAYDAAGIVPEKWPWIIMDHHGAWFACGTDPKRPGNGYWVVSRWHSITLPPVADWKTSKRRVAP